MADILHLVDDAALGGVNRVLDNQLPLLQGEMQHGRKTVRTIWAIPARTAAKIVFVHFTVSWAKLPYLIALRLRCRGKLVLVEHSYTRAFERHCVPNQTRFRLMLRLAYGLFDHVVAVSYGQTEWLRAAKLVGPERLSTIQPCVDLSQFLTLPLPQRQAGPLRLASYGRLAPQKGLDILIEAMRLVDPQVAELRIAGKGPDAKALLAQAQGLPHVHIEPAFVDPVAFLAEVDAVILPSRWEAYGVVAVESRAAGRPILVAPIDGLVDHVREGTGFCIDGTGPAAIAAAIESLAKQDIRPLAYTERALVEHHFQNFIQHWRFLVTHLLQDSDGERRLSRQFRFLRHAWTG
jgi:D-inositol-3-phosphate glycosyltransferase